MLLLRVLALVIPSVFLSPSLLAHGGVALVDDVCVMSLGNLSAHFAGYQPKTRKSKEFCEDIPDIGETIFVIDFIHDVLSTMPIDFRIVRDVNNVGLSATWEDLLAIENLQSATVHHQAPLQYADGTMKINYRFEEKGGYIGVVEAQHPTGTYRAVFPFRVGAKDFWDYLPYFLVVLLFLEIFYWISNGGLKEREG